MECLMEETPKSPYQGDFRKLPVMKTIQIEMVLYHF